MSIRRISIRQNTDQKWQVVETNLVSNKECPISGEDYDDEHTAAIAGLILAKMWNMTFSQKKELLR